MKECLLVALGGALGAVLRYLISLLPLAGPIPLLTLGINAAAALLMGFFSGWLDFNTVLGTELGLLLRAGFCGGFSTLSLLALELVDMAQAQQLLAAAVYVLLTLILCIGGIVLGENLATVVFKG
jgi:Integral membrane protein possibly involved in chromosome condensation